MVSIIVPIYNVERHVERCVHSLLEQSYPKIEFVFVDDGATDDSMAIVRRVVGQYPDRQAHVRYVVHEENKGLPAARNSGLAVADGDYIFHCDSDDWVEPSMIADMVQRLEETGADIVYTDFCLSFDRNERYIGQPNHSDPKDCIRAMLSGKMKFNVWNKLIRAGLYREHNILFPDGRSMGEDMTVFKLFCHAKNVSYIQKAYYHYMQTNPNAFTKKISQRQLDDVRFNTDDLITFLERHFGEQSRPEEIDFLKLNVKLPFLISTDKGLYALWREWYPEANRAIAKNPDFSLRIKLLQYAALYKQDWLVKLYNLLIVKFIYGVIYR